MPQSLSLAPVTIMGMRVPLTAAAKGSITEGLRARRSMASEDGVNSGGILKPGPVGAPT
jgi:hypothetical protein